MYSPPVDGIVIPALVIVDQTTKSQITPGVELPDENKVELEYAVSEMVQNDHTAAQFGINGTFIQSFNKDINSLRNI